MPKKTLFNDNEEETTPEDKLTINKSYADTYSRWRRAEEMQAGRLTKADLEDDDSESSDDEYADPSNPEFDRDFLKVLGALKTNDPVLKDGKKTFWKDSYGSRKKNSDDTKTQKIVSIRDLAKEKIMKKLEKDDLDDNSDEDSEEESKAHFSGNMKSSDDIAKPFAFEDDGLSDDEDMFVKREPIKREKSSDLEDNSEDDVYDYLKGKKDQLKSKDDEPILKNLRETWSKKDLSKKDEWLRDYFLNRRYLEADDDPDDIDQNASEDEALFNTHEQLECKYNFRFEEPDSEILRTFPRKIEGSLRSKSDTRKKERELAKKRKEDATKRKKQELMELRAQKKKELLERQKRIFEAAGVEYDDLGEELEGEFDPDKYDAYMADKFNEAYEKEKEDLKPEAHDSELEVGYDDANEYGDHDYSNYDDANWNEDYEEEYDNTNDEPYEENVEEKIEDYLDKKFGFSDIAGNTLIRFNYGPTEANDYGLSAKEVIDATTSDLNSWFPMRRIRKLNIGHREEEKNRKVYRRKAQNEDNKKKILPSLYGDTEKSHEEALERRRLKYKKKKERKQRAALRRGRLNTKIEIEKQILARRQARDQKLNSNEPTTNNKLNSETNGSTKLIKTNVESHKIKKTIPVTNGTDETPSTSGVSNMIKKKHINNASEFKSKKFKRKAPDHAHQNPHKKPKIENEDKSISDDRLKAFNLNPKTFKRKLKYGKQN